MFKKSINFVFWSVLFVVLFTNISYAAVAVTDENLNEAFQKYASSEINENKYNISVADKTINITENNESYILNYDLTNEPTFSLEIPIQTGMSYEKFKKQTDNLLLPSLGYYAIANIQGTDFQDAMAYFLLSYAESALNGSYSSTDSYVIVDDLNLSEGVTIEKTDDPKTIYTSEFGDRVIEYVNSLYKETQTITDSKGINSYTTIIEKRDETETSCKLVCTVSVNLDAEFSKIKEIVGGIKDSFMDNGITKENADYSITLKVGQKCKIETTKELKGYEIYGGCIEIDKEKSEITAIKIGDSNGYIYIEDEKKSFYVTVEENVGNDTLETIKLKIDNTPEGTVQEENNNKPQDDTTTQSSLPKAGVNNLIYFIIITIVIFGVIVGVKLKKYKDIK